MVIMRLSSQLYVTARRLSLYHNIQVIKCIKPPRHPCRKRLTTRFINRRRRRKRKRLASTVSRRLTTLLPRFITITNPNPNPITRRR